MCIASIWMNNLPRKQAKASIYITNRINVKINKHTNNYKTIDWININYFINALLQNCLHSKFRYHIFAS